MQPSSFLQNCIITYNNTVKQFQKPPDFSHRVILCLIKLFNFQLIFFCDWNPDTKATHNLFKVSEVNLSESNKFSKNFVTSCWY